MTDCTAAIRGSPLPLGLWGPGHGIRRRLCWPLSVEVFFAHTARSPEFIHAFLPGNSNMASLNTASQMERSPRRLNLYSTAFSTMKSASASNRRDAVHFEQPLILLDERVLRFGEMRRNACGSSGSRCGQTGNRPMSSGINPKLFGGRRVRWRTAGFRAGRRVVLVPDGSAATRRSMCCSMPANAPPQMNRMFLRVDGDELLLRVLAAALRGHIHFRSFEQPEALAGRPHRSRRA